MQRVTTIELGALAAEVDYRHPRLTIVADGEPLDSVLTSVGREMQMFVTTPPGLNLVIDCDIREQPVKLAFKKLLGNMSYTLQWKDDGEHLASVTVLSGSEEEMAKYLRPMASGETPKHQDNAVEES